MTRREEDTLACTARPRAPAPHPAGMGMFWFAGWLFTIGFVPLVWWKAILALLVWPYVLGVLAR